MSGPRFPFARVLRRLGWSLCDQAASSLTNLLLALSVAQVATRQEFGAFSLVFSTFLIVANIARALVCEPLVVRHSGARDERSPVPTAAATGSSLALGVSLGMPLLVFASLFGEPLATTVRPFALALPALLVQDVWRFASFADRSPRRAVINDLTWLVVQVTILLLGGPSSSSSLRINAWLAGGCVAAALGAVQTRVVPAPRRAFRWLRDHGDLGIRFALEFTVEHGAVQMTLVVLGAVAGLAEVGSLSAARLLFGPLTVVLFGATAFAVPEGVRLVQSHPARLRGAIYALSLALALITFAWGLGAYLVPEHILRRFLSDSWTGARPLLLPLIVLYTFFGVQQGCRIGLRSLADAKRSFRARATAAPILFLLGVVGSIWLGARGAAMGLAAGTVAACLISVHAFRESVTEATIGSPRPAATPSTLHEGTPPLG